MLRKILIRSFSQFNNPNDYYAILNLPGSASQAEIKAAYILLAKKLHPDMPTGDEHKFKLVAEAYEHLGNADKRIIYDTRHTKAGNTSSKVETAKDNYSSAKNHQEHRSAKSYKSQPFQGKKKETSWSGGGFGKNEEEDDIKEKNITPGDVVMQMLTYGLWASVAATSVYTIYKIYTMVNDTQVQAVSIAPAEPLIIETRLPERRPKVESANVS